MNQEKLTITLKVSFAWWLPLYLSGVWHFAWLTGAEPDWDKVSKKVASAARLEVIA